MIRNTAAAPPFLDPIILQMLGWMNSSASAYNGENIGEKFKSTNVVPRWPFHEELLIAGCGVCHAKKSETTKNVQNCVVFYGSFDLEGARLIFCAFQKIPQGIAYRVFRVRRYNIATLTAIKIVAIVGELGYRVSLILLSCP